MNAIINPATGKFMKYHHLIYSKYRKLAWVKAATNKSRHLMNGLKRGIKATRTMHSITSQKLPQGRKLTYFFFCQLLEPKRWTWMIWNHRRRQQNGLPRWSTNKNIIPPTIKWILNSIVSTANENLQQRTSKMYTRTHPWISQSIWTLWQNTPTKKSNEYNFLTLLKNNYVYIETVKGTCGIPQSGLTSNWLISRILDKYGLPKQNTLQYCAAMKYAQYNFKFL